jgi:hypothetical protein
MVAFVCPGSTAPAMAKLGCNTEAVHNYLKALAALPELRGVPTNGLPFGPRSTIRKIGGDSLVSTSEELGFKLTFGVDHTGRASSHKLNWLATASLARIDRQGQIIRVLKTATRHIPPVTNSARGISFPVPFQFKSGLYRLQIVFRNGADKTLGRFGEYFRALHETGPKRRLVLNSTSLLPAETVSAVAEEPKVGWLSLSDTYSIEIYDESTWVRALISPPQLSLLVNNLIGPGEATSEPCWSFPIPTNAPPGLYRFVVRGESMSVVEGRRLVPDVSLRLTSEFRISSPS